MLKVILIFEMLATSSNSLKYSESLEDRMVLDKENKEWFFHGFKVMVIQDK